MIKTQTALYVFIVALLILSCAPKEETVTKEEALQFAKKLEYSLQNGNERAYDSLFNVRVFSGKVAKETGSNLNNDYLKGVAQALTKSDLGKLIVSLIKDNGSYTYLRSYQKDGRQHILFRFFQGEGLNYHDYELVKYKDGVRIADLFDYMTGQNFTKTVAQLITSVDDLSKEAGDMLADKSLKEMVQIKNLVSVEKYEEAKKYYDRLPESFKKEKIFQTMNLQITSGLSDDAYSEALFKFEQSFANDPSAQLALVDAYFFKKEYAKAIGALDKLDSAIGGDPFINYIRALLISQTGDTKQTIKYLEKLHKDMPEFSDGTIELMARYIENKEEEKAKDLIVEYKSNAKLDQTKLESIRILYPLFASSFDL